jgi:outer membrane murein-binding lipoprotein Lpp
MPILNNSQSIRRFVAAVGVVALIVAGCGSDDSSDGRIRSLEAEIETLEARQLAILTTQHLQLRQLIRGQTRPNTLITLSLTNPPPQSLRRATHFLSNRTDRHPL